LSGAITGVKDYKKHFRKAHDLVRQWLPDRAIFDPSLSFNGSDQHRWDTFMRFDIINLCRSSTIILLPNWKNSKGCNIELNLARDLGLQIYQIDDGYTGIDDFVEEATILDEEPQSPCLIAHSLVNGARGEAYGHPYDDYYRTASMFELLTGIRLTVEQAVKFMICVKLSREANKHGMDNIIDTVGYIECLAKVIDRQKEIDNKIKKWFDNSPETISVQQ
jgi:hypothetical protein